MRNVAFSIMLGALALLQIAVVAAALFPNKGSGAQVTSVAAAELHVRAPGPNPARQGA